MCHANWLWFWTIALLDLTEREYGTCREERNGKCGGGAYEVLEEDKGDEEKEHEEDLELGEADEAEHLVDRPRQKPGIFPPPAPADAPLVPHRSRSIAGPSASIEPKTSACWKNRRIPYRRERGRSYQITWRRPRWRTRSIDSKLDSRFLGVKGKKRGGRWRKAGREGSHRRVTGTRALGPSGSDRAVLQATEKTDSEMGSSANRSRSAPIRPILMRRSKRDETI
jgi:hypothetical protein